jgi:predicted dehydrogenase
MALRRRSFLEAIGSAGAGLLANGFAAAGAGSKLRVGVITEPGAGHLPLYLRPMAAVGPVEVVGICDPSGQSFQDSKEALGSAAASVRTFADHRELLRTIRPEIVFVTVEAVHAPALIEAALRAGAHVVTEKPPCVRLADFEKLVDLAASKQRFLMLSLPTRVTPPARKARELVERGAIGKIYGATMTWIADQTRLRNPAYREKWTAQKARAGGGQLVFHGIHYIDAVQYITGDRITRATGFTGNVGGQPLDVEDAAVLALEFKGGAVGTLNTGYYLDKDYENRLTVWGSNGWLRFGFTSDVVPLEWYSTQPGAPKGVQKFEYSEQDGYRIFTEEAIQAARGAMAAPIAAADGLHALRVAFAGYRAAETGRTQTIA